VCHWLRQCSFGLLLNDGSFGQSVYRRQLRMLPFRTGKSISVAFRSAKAALLSRSERRLKTVIDSPILKWDVVVGSGRQPFPFHGKTKTSTREDARPRENAAPSFDVPCRHSYPKQLGTSTLTPNTGKASGTLRHLSNLPFSSTVLSATEQFGKQFTAVFPEDQKHTHQRTPGNDA
jgi:hypothetical protein